MLVVKHPLAMHRKRKSRLDKPKKDGISLRSRPSGNFVNCSVTKSLVTQKVLRPRHTEAKNKHSNHTDKENVNSCKSLRKSKRKTTVLSDLVIKNNVLSDNINGKKLIQSKASILTQSKKINSGANQENLSETVKVLKVSKKQQNIKLIVDKCKGDHQKRILRSQKDSQKVPVYASYSDKNVKHSKVHLKMDKNCRVKLSVYSNSKVAKLPPQRDENVYDFSLYLSDEENIPSQDQMKKSDKVVKQKKSQVTNPISQPLVKLSNKCKISKQQVVKPDKVLKQKRKSPMTQTDCQPLAKKIQEPLKIKNKVCKQTLKENCPSQLSPASSNKIVTPVNQEVQLFAIETSSKSSPTVENALPQQPLSKKIQEPSEMKSKIRKRQSKENDPSHSNLASSNKIVTSVKQKVDLTKENSSESSPTVENVLPRQPLAKKMQEPSEMKSKVQKRQLKENYPSQSNLASSDKIVTSENQAVDFFTKENSSESSPTVENTLPQKENLQDTVTEKDDCVFELFHFEKENVGANRCDVQPLSPMANFYNTQHDIPFEFLDGNQFVTSTPEKVLPIVNVMQKSKSPEILPRCRFEESPIKNVISSEFSQENDSRYELFADFSTDTQRHRLLDEEMIPLKRPKRDYSNTRFLPTKSKKTKGKEKQNPGQAKYDHWACVMNSHFEDIENSDLIIE